MAMRTVAGSGYGNVFVDSLIWGGTNWDPNTPIKVWLGDPGEYDEALNGPGRGGESGFFSELGTSTLADWVSESPEENAFLYALGLYESVCGLRFDTKINSVSEADIVWWKVDTGETLLGVHENPGMFGTDQIWGYFNHMATASWSNLHFGGDGLSTVIHEIGHGLGLAHPHDGGSEPDGTTFPGIQEGAEGASQNPGDYAYNQSVNTVMSYVPGALAAPHDLSYGGQGGLGAFDIAALQTLYGPNTTTAAGNNVYTLPTFEDPGAGPGWTSIWDVGGNDTINAMASAKPVTIDLRAANLVYGSPGAGGYLSQQDGMPGGFTIANGVVIENAVGGSGDDQLAGNSSANQLGGNGGHDVLIAGGLGSDWVSGGLGNDTLLGGGGKDIFVFDAKLGTSKTDRKVNFDGIKDYKVKDDSIQLDNAIFKKLGKPGKLNKKYFSLEKARDKDDYLIYSKKTGILSYDADGSRKGQPIEIAKLSKNLKMAFNEFQII
jgi:serralysin